MGGAQRTIFESWFSPFAMWAPGIRLRQKEPVLAQSSRGPPKGVLNIIKSNGDYKIQKEPTETLPLRKILTQIQQKSMILTREVASIKGTY